MKSKSSTIICSLLGLLVGCAGPTAPNPGALRLNPQQASFPAGVRADFTLTNDSDQQIGFNACFHQVQRREGGSWVDVISLSATCQDYVTLLDAGATAELGIDLVVELPAGTYRVGLYQLRTYPGNEPFPSLWSGTFTVVAHTGAVGPRFADREAVAAVGTR